MMKKKSTMKRMILTGAAVAVMMSFAAPAMALPPHQVGPTDPPVTVAPPDPPVSPFCAKHPEICGHLDDLPPLTIAPPDDPPANPPTDPPANPPADPNAPGDTNEGRGSNAAGSAVGGSYGTESDSGTFDRGGAFISDLLPNAFTSTLSDTGNSVKENLPASVAKSLPISGGGWTFLALVVAALIAGGLVVRSLFRRAARVTRSA